MNILRKKIAVPVLLLAVIGGLFFLGKSQAPEQDAASVLGADEMSMTIDYGQGDARMFVGNVGAGARLTSVVSAVSEAGNIPVAFSNNGLYYTTIDGIANGADGKRWVLYINERRYPHQRDLSDVLLHTGDRAVFRFE
ncbi:MAG: hypothetical protein Q8R13_03440 [bacterium]|nr:hypothetical protein [bacterium]MDZ4296271.1 hypothetical protein [Patescibacteria group bacterium]MDZ4296282.1 hypothetical protein [Patescibacteria group bacterium]